MTAYLDHAATTPLRPQAFEAMIPYLTERFGNPSGVHSVAREAKRAIEDARETVADCIGCEPNEIVFTGSGTEADNLAVVGRSGVAVCSAVEHHAVLDAVERSGGRVVPVESNGVVDVTALEELLGEDVGVVSVMLANNEVGTIQPLGAVADVVRRQARNAALHTDAVQAFPWLDVAELAAAADLVSISAHKFGGPKGVGALVVRRGTDVRPVLIGGGQERELRSGTHNVAGIVGMAAAMKATVASRVETVARVAALRDRLADGIMRALPGTVETGNRANKIAGNCHLRFRGVESEALLVLLDDAGVCASAGSACASGALDPSHVLVAMGIPREDALSSVRLSLGWTTTEDDVELATKAVVDAVMRLRDA